MDYADILDFECEFNNLVEDSIATSREENEIFFSDLGHVDGFTLPIDKIADIGVKKRWLTGYDVYVAMEDGTIHELKFVNNAFQGYCSIAKLLIQLGWSMVNNLVWVALVVAVLIFLIVKFV